MADQHSTRDPLLLGLLLLIVWLPLPLGNNRLFFWSLTEILIALLAIAWLIGYWRGTRRLPDGVRGAWPLYAPLGLWCGYVLLQCLPLPAAWVESLSPQAAGLHGLTYRDADASRWFSLSVEPFATWVAWQKSVSYLLLTMLVLMLVSDRSVLRRVALAVVVSGVVQAVIALFDWSAGLGHATTRVNGSFANPNHLANYLTLAVAVGLGLLLAWQARAAEQRAGAAVRSTLDWLLSDRMRLRLALLTMAMAIVLTRSRMGNVAFFAAILVAGALMLALARERRRGMVLLLAGIVVIDIVIVGSLVGVDRVVERLGDTSLAAETRFEVARDTREYWRDFRLTGSGLGTFYATYPRYKQGDVTLFYRQAHNDYLQFAAETGVIGIVLLGSVLASSAVLALATWRRRRDAIALGMAFTMVMAVTAVLVHATVEFNLQIFANAATLLAVLALGWVGCRISRRSAPTTGRPGTPRGRRALIAGSLSAGLLLYVGSVLAIATADRISRDNERLLAGWRQGAPVDLDQVQAAMRRQLTAIQLTPGNAKAKLVLSRLTWWQLGGGDAPADRQTAVTPAAVYGQMMYALLAASRDNPGLANTWVAIATTRHLQRRYDATFQAALLRAARLAPWEPHVQQAVARIGLAAWDALAGPAQRALVADTVARGAVTDATAMAELVTRSGRQSGLCAQFGTRLPALICGKLP